MITGLDLESLIAQYKVCAKKHGEATMEGNYKRANMNYDKLVELLKKIRQFGNEGNIALLSLTEDENQSVRCWASTDSLQFDKSKAIKVLKKLAKEDGIIAFDAKMVLSECKKGTLKLP